MLTYDDVRSVPLFATLAAADVDLLARSSADLQVPAGEVVLHPGAHERALYVVLAGNVQVFLRSDGVERDLYQLGPGDAFGVVPITLGTQFLGGYRATEPTRVMRVGLRAYHTIARITPSIPP